jgi:hypothetical protein
LHFAPVVERARGLDVRRSERALELEGELGRDFSGRPTKYQPSTRHQESNVIAECRGVAPRCVKIA